MMQDYGKFGIVDMDDKQKLFRLTKRLNADGAGGNASGPSERLQPASRAARNSRHYTNMDTITAQMKAQMLDGDAALLDLANEPDEGLLLQVDSPHDESYSKRQTSHRQGRLPDEVELPKIRVVVRKRPLNSKESERGEDDAIEADMMESRLVVHEPRVKVDLTKYVEHHAFAFDDVLDERVSNDAVYRSTVQPLVATIFRSGKATCFAYGQTGSGKTYTMQPLPLRAASDIFTYLGYAEHADLSLWVSCFEIYGGKLFDLLNSRQGLVMREDGKGRVCIVGLKEVEVSRAESIRELVAHANKARSTGSTGVNEESSRSHSIMQFALKRGGESDHPVGKISFVDLAGSERGADTYDNNRQTRMEGAQINKSLLALKECIRALDASAQHVPFRGSKLTEVLRDSFTGDQARTVMIANVSPAATSCEHTLNTLRYADRVKELRKDKGARFSCAASGAPVLQPPQNGRAPSPVGGIPSPRQAGPRAPSPSMRPRQPATLQTTVPGRQATPQRGPRSGADLLQSPAGARGSQRPASPRDTERGRSPLVVRGRRGTDDAVKVLAAKRAAAAAAAAEELAAARPTSRRAASEEQRPQPPRRATAADDAPQPKPLRRSATDDYPVKPTQANPKAASRRTTADEVTTRAKAPEADWRPAAEAGRRETAAEPAAPDVAAELNDLLFTRDELMNRILEEEDNLIAAHRWQIEETMAIVRQEMNLLGQIDQPGSAIDAYIGGLREVLDRKASNIAQLQGRLENFQAQLRDEEELSAAISAKMHLRRGDGC
ncbi:hypothetical protein WJX75_005265 [Coccomyxa subellipsoidea]|uniref:Kinesin-like protein n=1 Tax=Coccomyxa subellipsoidea TaxID=248742 RepID=A0ABR2YGG3_9CHLO